MTPGVLRDLRVQVFPSLAALLQKVSPASRVVLTHYLEGMTLEATAEELGVAPGTVKSRLAYGLRQLREAGEPNAAD